MASNAYHHNDLYQSGIGMTNTNGGGAGGTTILQLEKQESLQATTARTTSSSTSSSSTFTKYGGIIFALSASIFFSLSFLNVKLLQNRGFTPFGTAVLFNVGVILPAAVIIALHDSGLGFGCAGAKKKILCEIWPLSDAAKWRLFKILVLQGLLQAAAVICRAYSLQYLDIGDMTVIVFSSPILTTIIAHFVVGEPCGLFFVFVAIYTFCGVVLIAKPPMLVGGQEFDSLHLIGMAIAVGALLSLSMKFVVTRKIQDANVYLMTLTLGTIGFLISCPLFLIFEDFTAIIPKDLTEWAMVLGFFGAFCSIFSILKALTMEAAGPVALIRSLDVMFAFLLQFLFLDVVPDLLSSGGAFIVVSGVVTVGIRKWLLSTKYGQAHCGCCE